MLLNQLGTCIKSYCTSKHFQTIIACIFDLESHKYVYLADSLSIYVTLLIGDHLGN